ncbi:MAG TPA: AMP-binding protein [Candidatus Acidoferrum sp.]|jgi:long-chain acyl-CoA synthetase|nr:AMP-binding protein [Candidatus Acidoferrum sp.]
MIYVHSMERALRYYAERPALCLGQQRLTFRELHEQVKSLAATLTHLGFEPGDRLALLLPNGLEYIKFVYACSRLGVIVVPINIRLSTVEINRVLENACPRGLVRHSSLPAPTVRVPWELVLDQQTLDSTNYTCPDACYEPEAVLALIYTSGTTGHAKGVMVTHANILANLHHFNYWMRYQEGGVFLHAAPMFHIADFPAMFAAPTFGACQTALPTFSTAGFCEAVQTERVRYTVLVPTMINLLTQWTEIKKFDLSSLAVLAYGGSPMAPELVLRTRELLPNAKLVQVYGLSETGLLTGLQDEDHTGAKLLSCGRPCPGIDLQVADESGNQVESGRHGELVARGENVMAGYWNDREDTTAAFRNGFFRTGDIGYQDTDGYFYILDRLKDMIVTGGENVYCGEVEAAILTHPAVREVAVFGVPDPKWGELVAACVVVKPGMNMTADELIGHCRKSLANYKLPRRVEFLPTDLPKNGSGKVLKRILRERFWAGKERAVG